MSPEPAAPSRARLPAYRLVRAPLPPAAVPVLDPAQREVVAHPGGPLLVLAGPGTGKTTTLVEAVVERVRRGASPESVLVLTFSRKAAEELRERITTRLGRTVGMPSAWTFHAWCSALVSARAGATGAAPPRLLSGPERLVRVRELLRGLLERDGSGRWPADLVGALTTRGFAEEVADLLDRARERGLEPADLAALARAERRDDWVAAAEFFTEYLNVLADREMDYAELVRRALVALDDDRVLADIARRYSAVFVDEYQDTDPAQEELLTRLAGGGRDLVVVGDPDQSIYAFRGADVSCLLRFPDRFPTSDGSPAPVFALGVSRRAGEELLRCSRAVVRRLPVPGLSAQRRAGHRDLVPAEDGADPGRAEIRLFGTVAEEAAGIADLLRRAHLADGVPWAEMAVLVRSGVRSLPVLRRALVAAGVPVAVAADEMPVARDPAVAPLLLALRCASDRAALTPEAARLLLMSPLGRATPSDLRRLGRALRRAEREADALRRVTDGDPVPRPPRPAAVLIREAVDDPRQLLTLDERDVRPARRLSALLDRARTALETGGAAEQALWELWERSGWGQRLASAALAGGQAGRAADRDLDAIVALFDLVARSEERQPRTGVGVLLDELESQEIPSQSRAEGSLAGGAVRLLTAHRSKGLEWTLVVVAGVQEGVWPDLRRRSSLLDGDRLSADGVRPSPGAGGLLADERRLFYVAVTRARRHLVVTAVQSDDDGGERPSRLLGELGLDLPPVSRGAPAQLTLRSLVGRLRRTAVGGDTPDGETAPDTRSDAIGWLARLASIPGADGRPRVDGAHPSSWWGMVDDSPGSRPVRPVDEPVRLSASAVSGYDVCPLRWFLDREARATSASSAAQGFGSVLHVLVRLVGSGAVDADVDLLLARLDEVWGSLGFEAPWQSLGERRQAEQALRRFLTWHTTNPRRNAGNEVGFEVQIGDALLRGSVDRLDVVSDVAAHGGGAGGVVVVDFKTGKSAPTEAELDEHPQLGIYQLAVREGAFTDVVGPAAVPVGAELVHLRKGKVGPKVQGQPPLQVDEDGTTRPGRLLAGTAEGVRREHFPARPNPGCPRCPFARCCPAHDSGAQVVS